MVSKACYSSVSPLTRAHSTCGPAPQSHSFLRLLFLDWWRRLRSHNWGDVGVQVERHGVQSRVPLHLPSLIFEVLKNAKNLPILTFGNGPNLANFEPLKLPKAKKVSKKPGNRPRGSSVQINFAKIVSLLNQSCPLKKQVSQKSSLKVESRQRAFHNFLSLIRSSYLEIYIYNQLFLYNEAIYI